VNRLLQKFQVRNFIHLPRRRLFQEFVHRAQCFAWFQKARKGAKPGSSLCRLNAQDLVLRKSMRITVSG
jgi:hypothetical protein